MRSLRRVGHGQIYASPMIYFLSDVRSSFAPALTRLSFEKGQQIDAMRRTAVIAMMQDNVTQIEDHGS